MKTEQFENKSLSHFSYAVISGAEMVVIDPGRDPEPYLDAAQRNGVVITHVIETHPHADFVSCHLELHQRTGAVIHTSRLQQALYPHEGFDDGDIIYLETGSLCALNTPGHSPDSISILMRDKDDVPRAVFTGDTLFIGDCGRPDLREDGDPATERHLLASQMYHSLHHKLMALPDDVIVYPAHGAGSLCGKGLREGNSSTVGAEKISNWSLGQMTEEHFVEQLLSEQPFTPAYFSHDVQMNRNGASHFDSALSGIRVLTDEATEKLADEGVTAIDVRRKELYSADHLPAVLHLPEGLRFETWLGTIIRPGEPFVLVGDDEATLRALSKRVAAIGYEAQLRGLSLVKGYEQEPQMPLNDFRSHPEAYTIVDIRQENEAQAQPVFAHAVNIPLHSLRDRWREIADEKPVVIHCAGGYRSAIGSSLLRRVMPQAAIFDLGEAIQTFMP